MVDMDEVLTEDNFLKFLEIYLGKKLPDCYNTLKELSKL